MTYELTDDLVNKILDGIMDGKSVRQICADPDMPDNRTVQRWIANNAEFAAKCARARELQADNIFEDMQEVADYGNPDDVQRARLRVSTMQWRAAKLAPKKYGEKIQAEHTGADGGPLQVQMIERRIVDSSDD
jgi:hypothetical protein